MKPILLVNSSQVVTSDPRKVGGVFVFNNYSIGIEGDRIVYLGQGIPEGDWDIRDLGGNLITPGLIDPHTHPLFAGTRADEYEMRLKGKTYSEIAASGGGINRTVAMTRAASDEELYQGAKKRLLNMLAHGTTTVEVKSGYGLSTEEEIRQLKILKRLKDELPIEIHITFLGAHDIPPEYKNNRQAYIDLIINDMLPEVERLGGITFCDVFCETGVFTPEEALQILNAAKGHGLIPKVHANELGPGGGVEVAYEVEAISADHLNYLSRDEIMLFYRSKVVPVLLPATSFNLGLGVYPPARDLIDSGVAFALATDCNPGSCYLENLCLVQSIACNTMKITPDIAFSACTYNAARALGLEEKVGQIKTGMQADFVVWDAKDYRELSYHFGINLVKSVIKKGLFVLSAIVKDAKII